MREYLTHMPVGPGRQLSGCCITALSASKNLSSFILVIFLLYQNVKTILSKREREKNMSLSQLRQRTLITEGSNFSNIVILV